MATVDARAARLNLACSKGDDFTLTVAVTENGIAWDPTGATVASTIVDASTLAVAPVASFTSVTASGSLSLSLTDAQTTTLGTGTYRWSVTVTKAGVSRTWLAGQLSVSDSTTPGGVSSASLSISTSEVSVAVTSTSGLASNIAFTPTGNIVATDVQAAIAEVATDAASTAVAGVVELATNAEALTRTDAARAVTPANLSQFATDQRISAQKFLPTAAVAQTFSRADALTSVAPLSSGRLSFTLIWLPAGTYNSITIVAAGAGVTTPTAQWFAIYNATTRAKVAVTADDTSTAWALQTAKTLTISGGVTVTEGLYYIGLMVAAAGMPSVYGVSASNTTLNNLPPILTGADTTNTGLTTPATAPATAAALTASTLAFYAYVS